jgi:mannonate dehydratase
MIRFSMRVSPEANDEQLAFACQMGVQCVYTAVGRQLSSVAALRSLRNKVEDHSLSLYNVSSEEFIKNDKFHLALPARDRAMAGYQQFVRNLGEAGIGVTTFTWEPDEVWTTHRQGASRGATARYVDLAELMSRPLTHDRVYEREELWGNFAYFMENMAPVLRESGVKFALHPNDPPTDQALGGIPCLIHSRETYDRAFSHAPSDVLGMEFCCGCWLEGGDAFGDIPDGIRHFAADNRILIVHFRNVSSPLPEFTETFLDNGYADMYPFMRTFVEVDYQGTVILDHTPRFPMAFHAGGATGYAIGYMRALVERATAELEMEPAPSR